MKCIVDDQQKYHYPASFLVNGVRHENPEKPERLDVLKNALIRAGHNVEAPSDFGLDPVRKIHDDRYLTLLENAYTRWKRIKGAADEVTPNIHPMSRSDGYPKSVVAQAGFHMTDASAPISDQTWESALASANSALQAAEYILSGEEYAYALCRPPGHHASSDMAGGFCYLNNSAIATEHLLSKYETAAILDVDLHHGNGTQSIFYDRNDVMTLSIHADPSRFYPFFWGYEGELGTGDGNGYNHNYPLPRGSGDDAFLGALEKSLDRIDEFNPGILVVALGLDAFEGESFAGLAVTTKRYEKMARIVSQRTETPILMVQEGGYLCDALGDNLISFLNGITHQAHR